MKEEHLRYRRKLGRRRQQSSSTSTTAEVTATDDLDDCWESARLLAISHVSSSPAAGRGAIRLGGGGEGRGSYYFPTRAELPLLHACCLAADNIPRSLLEGAMRRCSPLTEFILGADAIHGNTPLHCVAASYVTFRRRPNPAVAVEVEEQQQDDLETVDDNSTSSNNNASNNDDLLAEVLRREPRAASMMNHNQAYPLDLAISTGGRTWKSGCRLLLEAHPAAILHVLPLSENTNVSKRLLTEIFSMNDNTATTTAADFSLTYAILHVIQPQVLFA
jgi:hypothetical protein